MLESWGIADGGEMLGKFDDPLGVLEGKNCWTARMCLAAYAS